MMYADPTFEGNIKWLTLGTAAIPQWRYNLAMLLAWHNVNVKKRKFVKLIPFAIPLAAIVGGLYWLIGLIL